MTGALLAYIENKQHNKTSSAWSPGSVLLTHIEI
jgi:hypothetical protein